MHFCDWEMNIFLIAIRKNQQLEQIKRERKPKVCKILGGAWAPCAQIRHFIGTCPPSFIIYNFLRAP